MVRIGAEAQFKFMQRRSEIMITPQYLLYVVVQKTVPQLREDAVGCFPHR